MQCKSDVKCSRHFPKKHEHDAVVRLLGRYRAQKKGKLNDGSGCVQVSKKREKKERIRWMDGWMMDDRGMGEDIDHSSSKG